MITEGKGKLSKSWDSKDKVHGFQRDATTTSVRLRRINIKEIPLDLGRISGDLSVE